MLKEMFKEVENMIDVNNKLKEDVSNNRMEIISLNEQLKTKFSNDKFVLISIESLEALEHELQEAKATANSCEEEISNIEYAEVQSVCSYIEDARNTSNTCYDEISSSIRKVETMLEVTEEAEAEEESA